MYDTVVGTKVGGENPCTIGIDEIPIPSRFDGHDDFGVGCSGHRGDSLSLKEGVRIVWGIDVLGDMMAQDLSSLDVGGRGERP